MAIVRYVVNNVDEAVDFYNAKLGFKVDLRPAPGIAALSKGDVRLLLYKPTGEAGQAMPETKVFSPDGWNRVQIEADDLESLVNRLKTVKAKFRNEIVTGQGRKQAVLEDPSGNLIELFEPNK